MVRINNESKLKLKIRTPFQMKIFCLLVGGKLYLVLAGRSEALFGFLVGISVVGGICKLLESSLNFFSSFGIKIDRLDRLLTLLLVPWLSLSWLLVLSWLSDSSDVDLNFLRGDSLS